MERPAIVIFGAAVLPDGRPSPSLLRRIAYAALAAEARPDAPILCSGGVGRTGPSEASVMADVLRRRGIDPGRLVLDEASLDTLQSVIAAGCFVRRGRLSGAVVCSDRYHLPRIRLMLSLLGVASADGPTAPGLAGTPWAYAIRMHLREGLAIPYDLGIVLARRRKFMAAIEAG